MSLLHSKSSNGFQFVQSKIQSPFHEFYTICSLFVLLTCSLAILSLPLCSCLLTWPPHYVTSGPLHVFSQPTVLFSHLPSGLSLSLSFLLQVFTQMSSSMEVDKDPPNDRRWRLFRVCSSKGVSHHHLYFGRDSKAEEWESFRVEMVKTSGVPVWRLLAWGHQGWAWLRVIFGFL